MEPEQILDLKRKLKQCKERLLKFDIANSTLRIENYDLIAKVAIYNQRFEHIRHCVATFVKESQHFQNIVKDLFNGWSKDTQDDTVSKKQVDKQPKPVNRANAYTQTEVAVPLTTKNPTHIEINSTKVLNINDGNDVNVKVVDAAKSQAKSATVSVQKSDGVNGSNPIKVEESASNLMMQMNQPFILLQRAQVNQLAVKPIPVTVRISKEESQKSLKEKLQKDLKSKVTKRKADLDMSNEAPKKQTRVTRSQVKSTDKDDTLKSSLLKACQSMVSPIDGKNKSQIDNGSRKIATSTPRTSVDVSGSTSLLSTKRNNKNNEKKVDRNSTDSARTSAYRHGSKKVSGRRQTLF